MTITHHRTLDPMLWQVRIWSKIIKRIISYPNTNNSTTVNTYHTPDHKLHFFTGPELLSRLCTAATSIGPDECGFTPDQIGLHSAHRKLPCIWLWFPYLSLCYSSGGLAMPFFIIFINELVNLAPVWAQKWSSMSISSASQPFSPTATALITLSMTLHDPTIAFISRIQLSPSQHCFDNSTVHHSNLIH
jgi:hypothetical protein